MESSAFSPRSGLQFNVVITVIQLPSIFAFPSLTKHKSQANVITFILFTSTFTTLFPSDADGFHVTEEEASV